MAKIPTMFVETKDGKTVRINKEDFDSKIHKEASAPKSPTTDEKTEEKTELPKMAAQEIKGTWFVIDADTKKAVELDGIDPVGYKTNDDANQAIIKVIEANSK